MAPGLFGQPEAYERHRERVGAAQAAQSREGRDIGPIPEVVDPERRAAAERSLRCFLETYFPAVFPLPWSDDHLRVIAKIESAVTAGLLQAIAMPRGSGKTVLIALAALWAVLTGLRKYVVVIAADQLSANEELLESIKAELEHNEMLYEDWPEVCYPIRSLEGINQRAAGQLYRSKRTHIRWTGHKIVLPTIEDSQSSGTVIQAAGLTGRIRGMKHARPDGKHIRPDLVLVDDPQTDESARSLTQCERRERLLSGAVLGLAGPGRTIAGLMATTVIDVDDMADRILDREKHPEWAGERTKMMYEMPERTDLWDRYAEILSQGLESGAGTGEATEFYRANRDEMDRGAKPAWEARYSESELSAVQHAMNIKIRDASAFQAEYQNDPVPDDPSDDPILSEMEIAQKTNGKDRGMVPTWATHVVAFIDVQAKLLFYHVLAVADDFTCATIDYGTYPDQGRLTFSLRDAKRTLQRQHQGMGREGAIRAGLDAIQHKYLLASWKREDGASLQVEQALVDAAWGESTDVVFDFCASAKAPVLPSFGQYLGAGSIPMAERSRKPGERVGHNWRLRKSQGRGARHVIYDANYWKSFVHARLRMGVGDHGALSLFGDHAVRHQTFAQHLTAEFRIQTTGQGRSVDEWKLRSKSRDNHWFDCVTGCMVAASIAGASLPGTGEPEKRRGRRRRKVRLSDVQQGASA